VVLNWWQDSSQNPPLNLIAEMRYAFKQTYIFLLASSWPAAEKLANGTFVIPGICEVVDQGSVEATERLARLFGSRRSAGRLRGGIGEPRHPR
jgi:hypothetical protein